MICTETLLIKCWVEMNHQWVNSHTITKLGTLAHIYECEKCGKRTHNPEGNTSPLDKKPVVNSTTLQDCVQ